MKRRIFLALLMGVALSGASRAVSAQNAAPLIASPNPTIDDSKKPATTSTKKVEATSVKPATATTQSPMNAKKKSRNKRRTAKPHD